MLLDGESCAAYDWLKVLTGEHQLMLMVCQQSIRLMSRKFIVLTYIVTAPRALPEATASVILLYACKAPMMLTQPCSRQAIA